MEVSSNILMLLIQKFLGIKTPSNFTHFLLFKNVAIISFFNEIAMKRKKTSNGISISFLLVFHSEKLL